MFRTVFMRKVKKEAGGEAEEDFTALTQKQFECSSKFCGNRIVPLEKTENKILNQKNCSSQNNALYLRTALYIYLFS